MPQSRNTLQITTLKEAELIILAVTERKVLRENNGKCCDKHFIGDRIWQPDADCSIHTLSFNPPLIPERPSLIIRGL